MPKNLIQRLRSFKRLLPLAIAKCETVDWLLSKALADNRVSDAEFQLIMTEFSQYNELKEALRAKLTRQPSRPNVEKIKKDIQSQVQKEFQKKIVTAGSN